MKNGEEVMFVDLECMGKTAETLEKYFDKGSPIMVEGRLRFRQWETEHGERRSKHDVFVERIIFTGARVPGNEDAQSNSQLPPPASQSNAEPEYVENDDDIPF